MNGTKSSFSFSHLWPQRQAGAYITHHFQLRERACCRLCVHYQTHAMPYANFVLASSPYCLCRHDWYAFMPFEYKIRDSSAPNSLEVFQYYSRACIRFRILCDPSAKSGLCQKRFSFAGYLTGRLRERQYQSESTVCEQTGERLQVN